MVNKYSRDQQIMQHRLKLTFTLYLNFTSACWFCVIFVGMRKLLVLLFGIVPTVLIAQTDKWDLRRCVEYAVANNISVKQADVQARIAGLEYKQANLNMYPTANFGTGIGMQFGRSIDPTSNQFTTTQLLYQGYQLQGNATIFNFGRLQHIRKAADFSAQAALTDVARVKNDISLNVATYYLQVLAAGEQINITRVQIEQTTAQYNNTKARVDAGSLPPLNLAEIEAQLASDSANLVTAEVTYKQTLLALKGLLALDAATPFEVATPPLDAIPMESLADLQPEAVYGMAYSTFPQQKANRLRIEAAGHNIKAARAAMFPVIGGNYNLSTTYNNQAQRLVSFTTTMEPAGTVTVNGTPYTVYAPNVSNPVFSKTSYGTQLDQNFQQSVGLNLSIPIFNNGFARINHQRSKLQLQSAELTRTQADIQLKQDIYTAYTNAEGSLRKYIASIKNVEAAQRAYDMARKRYELDLLNTIDLITTQNRLQTAKLQLVSNRLDYVFRMKLLEFYKGQGLKL